MICWKYFRGAKIYLLYKFVFAYNLINKFIYICMFFERVLIKICRHVEYPVHTGRTR